MSAHVIPATENTTVTEADIQEILEQGEAGVADVLTAYEKIEKRYFAAVAGETTREPIVSYATHT